MIKNLINKIIGYEMLKNKIGSFFFYSKEFLYLSTIVIYCKQVTNFVPVYGLALYLIISVIYWLIKFLITVADNSSKLEDLFIIPFDNDDNDDDDDNVKFLKNLVDNKKKIKKTVTRSVELVNSVNTFSRRVGLIYSHGIVVRLLNSDTMYINNTFLKYFIYLLKNNEISYKKPHAIIRFIDMEDNIILSDEENVRLQLLKKHDVFWIRNIEFIENIVYACASDFEERDIYLSSYLNNSTNSVYIEIINDIPIYNIFEVDDVIVNRVSIPESENFNEFLLNEKYEDLLNKAMRSSMKKKINIKNVDENFINSNTVKINKSNIMILLNKKSDDDEDPNENNNNNEFIRSHIVDEGGENRLDLKNKINKFVLDIQEKKNEINELKKVTQSLSNQLKLKKRSKLMSSLAIVGGLTLITLSGFLLYRLLSPSTEPEPDTITNYDLNDVEWDVGSLMNEALNEDMNILPIALAASSTVAVVGSTQILNMTTDQLTTLTSNYELMLSVLNDEEERLTILLNEFNDLKELSEYNSFNNINFRDNDSDDDDNFNNLIDT